MVAYAKEWITPETYLECERRAETKSEYYAGRVYAMAGAKEEHILINTTVVRHLGNQLADRPCNVYANDMRVLVESSGLYTYPDVAVVCGAARFLDARKDTLLNPTVIIEILSDSTEAYDRGDKFGFYRRLESLRDYVLIAQSRPRIEHYVRQADNTWLLREAGAPEETIRLESIGCELSVQHVYEKVTFPPEPNFNFPTGERSR